jgi:hypothetical protein
MEETAFGWGGGVAAIIINKQSWTADKGLFLSAWLLGEGLTTPCRNLICYKMLTEYMLVYRTGVLQRHWLLLPKGPVCRSS